MIELREIEGEPEKAPSDIRWIAGFSLQVFSNLTGWGFAKKEEMGVPLRQCVK